MKNERVISKKTKFKFKLIQIEFINFANISIIKENTIKINYYQIIRLI